MITVETPKKDFIVDRRSDFLIRLICKDGDKVVIDLNGYSFFASVWNKERTHHFANFTVTYPDRENGVVDLKLTDEQTALFNENILKYDILVLDPDGDKTYILQGRMFIDEGYTEQP